MGDLDQTDAPPIHLRGDAGIFCGDQDGTASTGPETATCLACLRLAVLRDPPLHFLTPKGVLCGGSGMSISTLLEVRCADCLREALRLEVQAAVSGDVIFPGAPVHLEARGRLGQRGCADAFALGARAMFSSNLDKVTCLPCLRIFVRGERGAMARDGLT